MLTQQELAETIQGCRKQDRTAQNRLYTHFYDWASAVCLRYTNDIELAHECVQDAFFKVFLKIDHYPEDLRFEAWFKRILVNTCIDRFRKSLLETPTTDLTAACNESIGADILEDADADYLLHYVQQLPPAYQSTFNLHAVEGYPYLEVAEMLGVSVGAVKSNLSKARTRLQELLLDARRAAAVAG